jgi:hypothetical protein
MFVPYQPRPAGPIDPCQPQQGFNVLWRRCREPQRHLADAVQSEHADQEPLLRAGSACPSRRPCPGRGIPRRKSSPYRRARRRTVHHCAPLHLEKACNLGQQPEAAGRFQASLAKERQRLEGMALRAFGHKRRFVARPAPRIFISSSQHDHVAESYSGIAGAPRSKNHIYY